MKTSRCTKAEVTYSKYIDMNINVETDIPTQSGFDVIALRGYFLCIRQSGWEKQRNTAFLYF